MAAVGMKFDAEGMLPRVGMRQGFDFVSARLHRA